MILSNMQDQGLFKTYYYDYKYWKVKLVLASVQEDSIGMLDFDDVPLFLLSWMEVPIIVTGYDWVFMSISRENDGSLYKVV